MAKKPIKAASDVYTAILGLASLAVFATAVFVAVKCMAYYGTLFTIASAK